MSEKEFLKKYFDSQLRLIDFKNDNFDKIIETKNILVETHSKGKKTLIFGNGGSAAIASHFSVDLTKPDLIKFFACMSPSSNVLVILEDHK